MEYLDRRDGSDSDIRAQLLYSGATEIEYFALYYIIRCSHKNTIRYFFSSLYEAVDIPTKYLYSAPWLYVTLLVGK